MAQPLQDLKEPLISLETRDNLNQKFLKSYRGIKSVHEVEEAPANEDAASEKIQSVLADEPPKPQRYEHQLIDFKEKQSTLFEDRFNHQSYLKDFYSKASAAHELPGLTIEKVCQQRNNPNIFAVLSKSSETFKEIEVHEFMCFEDYKKLTKIRLRNYINILRMLTKIDSSPATYQEVKLKLYQIKKLTSYLELNLEKLYENLDKNDQIYDLEVPKEEKPKSEKAQSQKGDQEGEINSQNEEEKDAEDQDKEDGEKEEEENQSGHEEEEEEEAEEDREYQEFFKLSELSNGYRRYYTSELSKEELKWVARAEWLEAMLKKIQENDLIKGWAPWFQAKLDQLADLDVPIKEATRQDSNQVFYLYKYIDEFTQKYNPEQEYHKDLKIYPEEQNQYPRIKADLNYSLNEASATLKAWSSLREKLCRRIKTREEETEYFITVFEKKPFGNEKIYEKRLNLRGKAMYSVEKLELHPDGGYLYLEFSIYNYNEYTQQVFRLIFNLNAHFKDPLFIKKDSQYLDFQDKFFYAKNNIKQKIEKTKSSPSKPKEETAGGDIQINIDDGTTKQPEEEIAQPDGEEPHHEEEEDQYEEFERIYEYDLIDFNKVRYVDLKDQAGKIFSTEDVVSFEKYKDGFLFLKKKYLDPEEKFFNFEIQYKTDTLKMDNNEKFDSQNSDAVVNINGKCDKILITYWKDGILTFQRYTIEFKEKRIKKSDEIKIKTDQITLEKNKVDFSIDPLHNDFILLFKAAKGKKIFIYQNDTFISSVENDFENLKYSFSQEKGLINILIQDSSFLELARKNIIKYQICEQVGDKDKKEWVWTTVSHEIYNQSLEICFPYAYCIYNHDQVYMKDLTKQDGQGYYYMNSFMGIEPGFRPLCLHSVAYANKLNLVVPTINSKYTATDFLIKVHQIKSMYEQNHMFKFQGAFRFRIYSYNQDILSLLSQWSGLADTKGRLHSDIRISSKYHSMNVEQWEKGKCTQRIVVSHYHKIQDESRDVTRYEEAMEYRPQGSWFIVTQRIDGQSMNIEVFTRPMRYSFRFPELITLKSVWDYSDDDNNNAIYGIYVDSFVKGKIDLYILYSNCQMRKFSATNNTDELQFEEHTHMYSLEYLFKGLEKDSGDAASKKTNLFDQYRGDIFIANSIFYSQQAIVDLSAQNYQDKFQIGNEIKFSSFREPKNIIKFTFSQNEAKIAAFYKAQDVKHPWYTSYPGATRNGVILITQPLYNSRQVPLFHHRQFIHPVVPIVDKEKGCTSVFTLTLHTVNPGYMTYYGHNYQQRRSWNKLVNINPGLIIKYFNGIEEQVPLYKFGEQYLEITRFQQSKDGQYVLIVGIRKGLIEDRFYDQRLLQSDTHSGMFLYKVSVNNIVMVKAFLFAQFNPYSYTPEQAWKFQLPAKKIQEQVPPEIEVPLIGEYSMDYIDNDGNQTYGSYYEENINFKDTDEAYVDQLKQEREAEKLRKRQEEEALLKKNRTSGRLNRSITIRQSLIQSLGEEDKDNDHHSADEAQENQEQKQEDEFANIQRLENLLMLFPQFDIPYQARFDSWQRTLIERRYENIAAREYETPPVENKPEGVEQFTYEYEKALEQVFNDEQVEKIKKIHANMHLTLNENGHIFLINRLNNKLYFFYECLGEYKVVTLKFEPEFQLISVDSSSEYLIVTARDKTVKKNEKGEVIEDYSVKHRFRILNISKILKTESHDSRFTLQELEVYFDSKTGENLEVKKEAVGNDEYTYTIDDCKIIGSVVILKVTDNQSTNYLKIYDIKKNVITYYIEGKRFLISGDKKYIWAMDTNEVYDIVNGLSTLFIWPGDQINTHSYDHMDLFNVNNDRTIMVTQGYLQLAFNYLSFKIDDELETFLFKQNDTFFSKVTDIRQFFYKISDYKSLLEKVFLEDADKLSLNKYQLNSSDPDNVPVYKEAKEEREAIFNKQVSQNKSLSGILTYIAQIYDPEKAINPAHISNYFLSFYSIDKKGLKGGDEKNPKYLNIFEKMFAMIDKRGDLIEDILNHVVHAKTVPITQSVINSCFTDFLVNANSSQSFQYYLNNITSQTSKMQEIEKFQIASTEQGFIVESYDSPIMDDRFHSKFRQVKEPKIDTEITYIQLGTLLQDHGQEIMDILSDKKYLAIMDIPFIRYLVMYQWFNIKNKIYRKLLYPFMALLFLFTLYTTLIDFQTYKEGEEEVLEITKFILNWINSVLLLFILGYFLKVEASQFIKDPADYFTDFWNISDLCSYSLCLVVIIFDRTPVPNVVNRPIASLCLIILWIKMFYFLRVFESTSKLIRMIIEIVNDMKNFLIVMFIGIVGFSGGFYILQQAVPYNPDKPDGVIGNYVLSMIYTYRLAMGDFQLDFFDDLEGADYFLSWFLFIFGSLFLVIVLLNLLIAIMGDTFSRVLESITNLTVREKVMLVAENEALFNRSILFSKAQFLIIITEKNLDSVQAENWDGQINALKRQVLDKVSTLETNLDFKITENQKDLKKKIIDLEERSKKQSTSQEQRISSSVNEVYLKIHEQFAIQQASSVKAQQVQQEQIRMFRMMQDQMDQLRNEQNQISQSVKKALGGGAKEQVNEDDD